LSTSPGCDRPRQQPSRLRGFNCPKNSPPIWVPNRIQKLITRGFSDWYTIGVGTQTNTSKPKTLEKSWVGKSAVSQMYGVSTRTVERWVALGMVPYRRLPVGGIPFHLPSVERRLSEFDQPGRPPCG
jgi:hypothetical protein